MSNPNWSDLHKLEEMMNEAEDKGQLEEARMLKRSYDKMHDELLKQDSPMRIVFDGFAEVFAPKC